MPPSVVLCVRLCSGGKILRNVTVEITFPRRLCSVSCEVSANLTDIEGVAVGATDLMNGSLSVPRFVFVCGVS